MEEQRDRMILLLNKVAQEINLPQPVVTMLKNLSLQYLNSLSPEEVADLCRYFVEMAVWLRDGDG